MRRAGQMERGQCQLRKQWIDFYDIAQMALEPTVAPLSSQPHLPGLFPTADQACDVLVAGREGRDEGVEELTVEGG